ncbi:hypothetical protein GCM10010483_33610 [Actinokineospora diospyrosa]
MGTGDAEFSALLEDDVAELYVVFATAVIVARTTPLRVTAVAGGDGRTAKTATLARGQIRSRFTPSPRTCSLSDRHASTHWERTGLLVEVD